MVTQIVHRARSDRRHTASRYARPSAAQLIEREEAVDLSTTASPSIVKLFAFDPCAQPRSPAVAGPVIGVAGGKAELWDHPDGRST